MTLSAFPPQINGGLGRLGASAGAAAVVTGWWLAGGVSPANAVAAYQPKGAADLATSYVNLVSPGTYNAAPGIAPGWAADTGWQFLNANNTNLRTFILAPGNQTWSAIIIYNNAVFLNDRSAFGFYANSAAFLLQATQGTGRMRSYHGTTANADAGNTPLMTSGTYAIAGRTPYRNGAPEPNIINISTTNNTAEIYIGALNFGASRVQPFTGNVQAFSVYNTELTAPQVAAISTAMSAL